MTIYTTPIYYVNAEPHLGHLYTTLCTDVLGRYNGAPWITGTDEHGAKIAQAALENEQGPQSFTDQIAARFKQNWADWRLEPDVFIRTTDADHKERVERALRYLYDNKLIHPSVYSGWYCQGCESYKDSAWCDDHQAKLEHQEENSWVLPLDKYRERLLAWYQANPDAIYPASYRAEVLAYLSNTQPDLCLTRANVSWGIHLPWDQNLVTYVWVDALQNYLTARERIDPAQNEPFIHLIGKDILRHHAIIWPALLLALQQPLNFKLVVHGHLLKDGRKVSKSAGRQLPALDELLSSCSLDAVRWGLLRQASYAQDTNITEDDPQRWQREIRNVWGNLVHRTHTLCLKHDVKPAEGAVSKEIKAELPKPPKRQLDAPQLARDLFECAQLLNLRFSEAEPWKNPDSLPDLLAALEILRSHVKWICPEGEEKIIEQLRSKELKPLY